MNIKLFELAEDLLTSASEQDFFDFINNEMMDEIISLKQNLIKFLYSFFVLIETIFLIISLKFNFSIMVIYQFSFFIIICILFSHILAKFILRKSFKFINKYYQLQDLYNEEKEELKLKKLKEKYSKGTEND